MTASTGKGRNGPRPPLWRKPEAPIWRAPATVACRGADTSLFYKRERETPAGRDRRVRKAKGMCASCLLRGECLETAMAEEAGGGARFGIRGGLTEEERKDLQRKRSKLLREEAAQAANAA